LDLSVLPSALLLFAASLVGALLPLYRRWSDRGLHVFVAVAAGIFLGTIFLHLLPELAGVDLHGHHHGPAPGEGAGLGPWIAALLGLLLLFAVERVWLPAWTRSAAAETGADPHTGLWAATFLGLSLHAVTAGVALSAILREPDGTRTQLLISILIHKATETFSLATVMRLANLGRGRTITLLLVFALIEPAGLLFGGGLSDLGAHSDDLLTGFACGTFLYVALCDLLPEAFHGVERPAVKLAAVAGGVGITALTLPRLAFLLDFGERLLHASIDIFVDFAPFLLLGFVIAGVLSQVLPLQRLVRFVRGDDLKSVGAAAMIGAPLPLCSCAVVPVAVSLRQAGASKGATSSFLIATPETGVDSVTVTWALLDPVMTIARPIGALVSAVFTGSVVNLFVRRGWDPPVVPKPPAPPAAPTVASCCAHEAPEAEAAERALAAEAEHAGHFHAAAPARAEAAKGPLVTRVLRYAFVEMLDDLTVSLLAGTLISALISVLLPADLLAHPAVGGFGGMLLMLLIGIPTYVCAAASTPIAATLIQKGLSPGAAFVFLLASPATNLGSLIALRKHLGARIVLVHAGALAAVTLLLGFAIDAVYAMLVLTPRARLGEAHEHGTWFGTACAVLLAVLMLVSLVRTHGTRNPLDKLRDLPAPLPR
jgi:uncharacterized membrane protein YraQ (UPF0718 family)